MNGIWTLVVPSHWRRANWSLSNAVQQQRNDESSLSRFEHRLFGLIFLAIAAGLLAPAQIGFRAGWVVAAIIFLGPLVVSVWSLLRPDQVRFVIPGAERPRNNAIARWSSILPILIVVATLLYHLLAAKS